ncbi:MAG TPA: thrombospondin type 3 repeat-containing protein [Candidatus Polarisedimenticolia bacterium]|nr:thrombospondin type 3 repeat-containing protein [Candidatus Polarisedimenticolia bacterium]
MTRRVSWWLLLASLLAFMPEKASAQPQVVAVDCNSSGMVSDHGGWQAPGADPVSGDLACEPDGAFIFFANYQAYYEWLLLAPSFGDLTVETEVLFYEREGADTDAFSLLLRWNGSGSPACCEPAHAASGLRLLFSLARNRVEAFQEIDGASGPLLGTLPFTLPPEMPRALKVNLRGTMLDLAVDGQPIGSLTVPDTPPALFGFDARGVVTRFAPFSLTLRCQGDFDCDGVADVNDNCPSAPPADQTDTDGDGLGNPCDSDDDGDGVGDASDHCPLAFDPGQEDADNDLVGDACDTCPLDAANDYDQDGFCTPADNCPFEANPDQADMNGNGVGDFCDMNDGFLLIRWADKNRLTWQPEAPYNVFNLYRRDVAALRSTGVYVLDPYTGPGVGQRLCNINGDYTTTTVPALGQATAYFISGSMNGIDAGFGEDSSGNTRPNDYPCGCRPMVRVLHNVDGYSLPANRIIDNLTDWCAFFPSACASGSVDFSTEVAVLHRWDGPCTSYDTEITCVEKAGTGVRVSGRNIEYQCPGCFFVIVAPYDVVKIARPATSATYSFGLTFPPCP